MLARAQAPIDRAHEAVLFYLYADDLSALRDRLVADGVQVGEIRDGTPGPSNEMGLTDPDGYCLLVAQIDRQGRFAEPGGQSARRTLNA